MILFLLTGNGTQFFFEEFYAINIPFPNGRIGIEELQRIVRFEVCDLVGKPSIAGSMRLHESEQCALFDVIPNRFGDLDG